MAAASRWQLHGISTNAEVSGALLRRKFRPEAAAMAPLRTALDRGLLTIRGVDRTLRVAWTLARAATGSGRTHACRPPAMLLVPQRRHIPGPKQRVCV